MENATDASRGPAAAQAALVLLLLESLQALAGSGQGELACRLAGRACAALRHDDQQQWQRFNALLHRLGPRTGPVGRQAGC